jgi:hypothetical protein
MTPEEDAYAAAFAAAIAEDIAAHPPGGDLTRVVLRWFEHDDPLQFTVHALGAEEAGEVPLEDAWLPLEWPNVDAEMERTDRLLEHPDVQRTGEALQATYEPPAGDDEVVAAAEGAWGPSAATIEVVRRLPEALTAAGVAPAEDFAASAAHFEGWGALAVLEEVADPDVLAALDERDELPID